MTEAERLAVLAAGRAKLAEKRARGELNGQRLTPQMERFCVEYLANGLNGKEAAKAAGYASEPAKKAWKLLKHPKVQERIEQHRKAALESNQLSIDKIVQEYSALAFFDPAKLFDAQGNPIPISELDEATRKAIAGLDVFEQHEGSGKDRRLVGYTKKYRLASKQAALDSLAEWLGMFKDKRATPTGDAFAELLNFIDGRSQPMVQEPTK